MSQPNERQKAVRILAKSLFKELTSQGFDDKQIVSLATELISQVTVRMADSTREATAREAAAAAS